MNSFENDKYIDTLMNMWKFINPYNWSRLDSYCWLQNWCQTNGIKSSDLKYLDNLLPGGLELCNLSLEYFEKLDDNYGIYIFEDLHILIASFYLVELK